MKTLFSFISLFLFTQCSKSTPLKPMILERSLIELPFLCDSENDLYFNMSIGTPPQTFKVYLHYFQTQNFMQIVGVDKGGEYDEKKSSTFKDENTEIKNGEKHVGKRADETFHIGNLNVTNVPFVLQDSEYLYTSQVGFGVGDVKDSFWMQLTEPLDSKKIVVAFETYPQKGFVSLGGYDQKRCFGDWKFLKLVQYENNKKEQHFGLQSERIYIGDDTLEEKPYITFNLNDEPMQWPQKVYDFILSTFKTTDIRTFPCGNAQKSIEFLIGTTLLRLQPEDYIDQDLKKATGECVLRGMPVPDQDSKNEIILTRYFFNKYCILIDHPNKQLGFSTRRPYPQTTTTSTTQKPTTKTTQKKAPPKTTKKQQVKTTQKQIIISSTQSGSNKIFNGQNLVFFSLLFLAIKLIF